MSIKGFTNLKNIKPGFYFKHDNNIYMKGIKKCFPILDGKKQINGVAFDEDTNVIPMNDLYFTR